MKRVFSVGVVTLAALALPLSALADHEEGRHGKRMSKIMSHLDKDESGTISLSEFQMPEGRDAPDMRMDLNGDGTLSRDEVTEQSVSTQKRRSRDLMRLISTATVLLPLMNADKPPSIALTATPMAR